MKPETASLLARIEQFQLGAPDDEAFVRRLARENGWPIAYAQRASEEYKRFAFLALASGHPCTPSDQVDQVWHLHLIHTQQYWHHFCGEVLRAPLHHTPSQGGAREAAKFRNWYERTLESYRAAFGAPPPADIWPPVALRFASREQRVDRNAVWIVARPGERAGRAARRVLVAIVAGFALAGCTLIHTVPPFNLRGPAFLGFFAAAWLGCIALASALRRAARRHAPDTRAPAALLDPYETAYLAGGSELAAHAVIATLVENGALQLDKDSGRFAAQTHPGFGAHRLELEVFRYCKDDGRQVPLAALRKLVSASRARFEQKLERAGLIAPHVQARRWLLLALLVPGLGAIKLIVAVTLGKPVAFLLIALWLSTMFSLSSFGERPVRTVAGDAELERMRQQVGSATEPQKDATGSIGVPVALAVGLFGVSVLADTAMADLGALLSPADRSGGGGCGGDGCGGGGCGGCGCGGCGD